MAEKIKLVSGDTKPQLKVVVKVEATGDVVSLVGATVRLLFRAAGATDIQATLTGTLVAGLEDDEGNVNSSAPYDVPGSGGRVVFLWGAGDLDCDAGDYEGEVKVTFADSSKQTVYEPLKFKVRDNFGV